MMKPGSVFLVQQGLLITRVRREGKDQALECEKFAVGLKVTVERVTGCI
jgi:hypothetical protein